MNRRRLAAGLLIGAGLLAVIELVIASGVLRAKPLDQRMVSPGDDMDGGNLVYSFTAATVQYDTTSFGDPWVVTVTGRVRNQTDSTQTPLLHPLSLIGVVPDVANTDDFSFSLGPSVSQYVVHSTRQVVPPGNEWIDLTVIFTYGEGFNPLTFYEVAVPPMTFSNTWIFGLGDTATWHYSDVNYVWMVKLPCERLPDKTE